LGLIHDLFDLQIQITTLEIRVLYVGQVKAMWQLGPDYQSTFQATESDPAFEQASDAAALVLQGKDALAPLLFMSYNAQVILWTLHLSSMRP
jgi:hypothetical protein